MLSTSQMSLDDIAKELSQIKTRLDINDAKQLTHNSGNNRYEIQMLLNNDTTIRNGRLTQKKFIRMCDLISKVNKNLGIQHGILFKLPQQPRNENNDGREAFFDAFYHTAIRLRKPYDFISVMGRRGQGDPDLFVDYLYTLLQKDNTIEKYVPAELEKIALENVPSGILIDLIINLIDVFADIVSTGMKRLSVTNLGSVVGPVLFQNTVVPLLRQSLVNSGSTENNLTLIGLVDLPQQIDMHVKGDIHKAWNKVFDVFSRQDYYSSNKELKKFQELLNVATPHQKLYSILQALYTTLSQVNGVSERDASLIVLLIHTAVHYIIHKATIYVQKTGDNIITDLGPLLDNDESFRSLLGLPYVSIFGSDAEDPDQFFTSAQKTYMKILGTYWEDVKRAWMHMTIEQKKKIRIVVQKKIEERLHADSLLLNSSDVKEHTKVKPVVEKHIPLKSHTYLEF